MKSGAPWKLKGRRPEGRSEIARAVARRSGTSVGEWLNRVIAAADDEDEAQPPPRDVDHEPPRRRWRQGFRYQGRHNGRRSDANRSGRDSDDEEAAPGRRQGGPYREEPPREPADQRRRDRVRREERAAGRASRGDQNVSTDLDVSIDQAVAEIMARQRALDGEAAGEREPAERPQPPAPFTHPGEGRAAPREGSPPAPENSGGYGTRPGWPRPAIAADHGAHRGAAAGKRTRDGDQGPAHRSHRHRPLADRSAAAARGRVARDRNQGAGAAHRSQPRVGRGFHGARRSRAWTPGRAGSVARAHHRREPGRRRCGSKGAGPEGGRDRR